MQIMDIIPDMLASILPPCQPWVDSKLTTNPPHNSQPSNTAYTVSQFWMCIHTKFNTKPNTEHERKMQLQSNCNCIPNQDIGH
jgi:hypothetical protein